MQLNYLNKSIEQLLDDNKLTVEKSTKNNLDVERFKSDLFELIELHQKLLDYKVLLESIFSFTFFITFSGATIIICLQGIMIKVNILRTVKDTAILKIRNRSNINSKD